MIRVIEAIYENGVLRPLKPLHGFDDSTRVKITIETGDGEENPLLQFSGILTGEEAAELKEIINNEFEQVDPDVW